MEESKSPSWVKARARLWAVVTSVAPACFVPCEEAMSLNAIWLDSGMTGYLPRLGWLPDRGDRWSGLQLPAEALAP